ncbi:MAG TPA: hypothetical protein VHX65_12220 [Pirellulales bacterium]|nr:hypothetical protein [Pirellulales bacterium]
MPCFRWSRSNRSKRWPEILRRCNSYMLDPTTPPVLLVRAADAFHTYAD